MVSIELPITRSHEIRSFTKRLNLCGEYSLLDGLRYRKYFEVKIVQITLALVREAWPKLTLFSGEQIKRRREAMLIHSLT